MRRAIVVAAGVLMACGGQSRCDDPSGSYEIRAELSDVWPAGSCSPAESQTLTVWIGKDSDGVLWTAGNASGHSALFDCRSSLYWTEGMTSAYYLRWDTMTVVGGVSDSACSAVYDGTIVPH